VNTVNGTVQQPRLGRRVVRRSAIDQAADTALAELPAEVRPAVIAYVDAKRAEYEARLALSSLMTRNGLRWRDVDVIAHKLAF
jgi:hypothetical protein